jgi:prepilin-type N-terminal cleavage/methylation domain-containing protein
MKNKKGFTLIEVIIAVLVAGIAVVAIFAVILSTFTAAPKSDQKETAGLILQQASERLKAYATDTSDGIGEFPQSLPVSLCPGLDGSYPFTDGQHNASCLLDGTILEGGTLNYTVANVTSAGEIVMRRVDFSLQVP